MNRIKRTISILLSIAMLLVLLPTVALAAVYPPAEISTVSVSVIAPTAGSTASAAAVTVDSTANYYVNAADTEWNKVAAKGSTASLGWLYDDDTFEDNNWYMAEITLYADFGYKFPNSITPHVPSAGQVSAESDGDTLEVCAWFPVGSPAATQTISTVEVTNVALAVGKSVYDAENTIEEDAITGTGYFIDGVYTYKWVEDDDDNDYSYWDWTTSGSIEAGTAYGVELTLLAEAGYAFNDTVTATINGQTAEVVSRTAGELVLFLPSEQNVTITKVEVKSATWPIDGNPIDKRPANFSFDNSFSGYLAYTLQSAEFQIKDGDTYRSLHDDETTFSSSNHYRVQAVLKAKDGATFADADSVTGDFNGTDGTTCEVSADKKTCTVTRTCAVYDAVYSYTDSNSTTHVNGVTIYRPDPTAGQTYSQGSYGPGNTGHLVGASAFATWHEVPFVGSTGNIKGLERNDTFESGKVYRLDVRLENWNDWRFAEGFTISFKQMDGSASNCAMMSVTTDTARTKSYSVWYTVGTVADPQPVTDITITGPALQSTGKVGTDNPADFHVTTGDAVISIVYDGVYNRGLLRLYLAPASGYYFGRSVTVTYNGISADVNVSATHDLAWADVDLCKPVVWSGIKVKDKVYDGNTNGELDLSAVTLTGVAQGDDVQLSCLYDPTVQFEDKAVGDNKSVSVFAYLTLAGTDAWKYRLVNPYLSGDFTASITDASTPDPDPIPDPDPTPIYPVIPIVTTYPVTAAQPENGAVTVSPANAAAGVTVTVTVKPDAGHELASLTVTDAGGKTITLTDKGDGKYTFTMPAGKVTVNAAFSRVTLPFVDVPADAYYYDAVAWAVENKITDGTSDITFSPDAGCTRGQIVTFLWRAAGCPEPKSSVNPFTDVEEGAYYSKAVLWAVENGITDGTGDGTTFSPDLTCTRDQTVTFLWRAAGKPAVTADKSFTDVSADAWYATAVAWAVENGITDGTGDGTTFSPADDCTRAQIVTFLYRFFVK